MRGDPADWGMAENTFLSHYLGLDQRLQTVSLWSEPGWGTCFASPGQGLKKLELAIVI